jgi:hypothetical protein
MFNNSAWFEFVITMCYNCILTHRGAAKGTYKVNPDCADVALQVRIILH